MKKYILILMLILSSISLSNLTNATEFKEINSYLQIDTIENNKELKVKLIIFIDDTLGARTYFKDPITKQLLLATRTSDYPSIKEYLDNRAKFMGYSKKSKFTQSVNIDRLSDGTEVRIAFYIIEK